MRKDLEALPHLALAAHFPPVSQGHEIPACCPQASRTQFLPESQVVSRQEQGRKKGLLSVFAGALEMASVEGDPSHTRSPHGRKEWFLFNCGMDAGSLFHTAEWAGNQAGPDSNVPEQNCWHSPPRPSPL